MILPLLLVLAAAPHPDSLSSSVLRVDGARVELRSRLQLLSLLEVVPGLDADGDGVVTAAEVELAAPLITSYVGEHYSLFTDTRRDLTGGVRLEPQPVSVVYRPKSTENGPGYRAGAVEVELAYTAPHAVHDLVVESVLFLETSPDHVDLLRIEWAASADREASEETAGLSERSPRLRFDPEGRGAFGAFVALGWHHILGGWDHLAFVFVLVLASRSLRALLGVVTAFTLAHSVSLALAALGVVDLSQHAAFVEALIALSIAYVAAEVLTRPDRRRAPWIEAFLFGLVHGLGFAGFLGQSLVQEASPGMALFGFNVGVELGQVAVVILLVGVLRLLPGRSARRASQAGDEAEPFLAPRFVQRAGAAAVLVLSLYWFFQRV